MHAASPATIDDYIAGFPKDVQTLLQKIRNIIAKAAPAAEEAIKYQIPTFILGENLVYFAAFKHHLGLYPTPSVIEAFREKLAGDKSAKGSVQFPLDRPIPFTLIQEMVEFRVKQVREKRPAKQRKK